MNHYNRDNDKPSDTEELSERTQEIGEGIVLLAAAPGQTALKAGRDFFDFLGDISVLFVKTVGFIFKGSINVPDTIFQMSAIGVSSLPIVVVTVAFSGAVLSLYMSQLVVAWGLGSYTGAVVGLSITREIAPVLTAVVVAARNGSGIAAEVGSMKVTEQIDALRALAVSPIEYLVVPRLVAALIMLPILGIFANVAGTWAGYLVAAANGVASGGFSDTLKAQVGPRDVYMGLIKTLFFATVIVLVGSQQGLRTQGGATGVGRSTTNAVVISIVIIYILNFILAYIMFNSRTV